MKTCIRVIVLLMIIAGLFAQTVCAQDKKLTAAPNVVPPATEEMQDPEFWISRLNGDPDRVIMTPEQIQALNRKNLKRPLEWKDINGTTVTIAEERENPIFYGLTYRLEDPLNMTSVPVSRLEEDFRKLRDYVTGRTLWDRRLIQYQDERKEEMLTAINAESLPKLVKPESGKLTLQVKFGLIIKHTLHRAAPTHEKVYGSQYGWLDMFQKAVLETGMSVAILWETKNHDWYYVKSEYSYGWVPAENVAVGEKSDIRRFAEPDKFIVSLNHKVPVFSNREFSTHVTDLYMGARLPLVNRSYSGYEVLVPYRAPDGSLKSASGWVKVEADVSEGFLPYTRRNAIGMMFKMLNRPYGWHGTDHERDCVGTIRAVYKTFGLFMCRWTTFMLYSTDHLYIFPKDTPKDVKYRYLDKCDPGITVCGFSGHVVFYLGKVDGVHYTIHQNGYSYHDEDGTELRIGRVSVNYTEIEGGGDINRWTELSEFKP